jgi:hypothetical protein
VRRKSVETRTQVKRAPEGAVRPFVTSIVLVARGPDSHAASPHEQASALEKHAKIGRGHPRHIRLESKFARCLPDFEGWRKLADDTVLEEPSRLSSNIEALRGWGLIVD